MLYLDSPGLLFTHVSRTAGTSIRQALRRAFPACRDLLDQHAALAEARPVLGTRFDDVLKFAVVRNPWERMASWYALVGLKDPEIAGQPEQVVNPESRHWRKFDRFLDSWLAETLVVDGVRRPRMSQWGQLADADGKLLTDTLLRYESLAADFAGLCNRAGLGDMSLERLNPSRHGHYSRYYSDRGRQRVAEAVPEDIEVFGYRFERVG